jgi:hypothetical protein
MYLQLLICVYEEKIADAGRWEHRHCHQCHVHHELISQYSVSNVNNETDNTAVLITMLIENVLFLNLVFGTSCV